MPMQWRGGLPACCRGPARRTLSGPNAATSAPSVRWLSSCAPKASRTTATWEGSLSPAGRGKRRAGARHRRTVQAKAAQGEGAMAAGVALQLRPPPAFKHGHYRLFTFISDCLFLDTEAGTLHPLHLRTQPRPTWSAANAQARPTAARAGVPALARRPDRSAARIRRMRCHGWLQGWVGVRIVSSSLWQGPSGPSATCRQLPFRAALTHPSLASWTFVGLAATAAAPPAPTSLKAWPRRVFCRGDGSCRDLGKSDDDVCRKLLHATLSSHRQL